MAIEREPLQILVRLEDVQPVEEWVTMIEPGVLVQVTGRYLRGFVGRVIVNPCLEKPFTVCIQEETP